MNALENAIQAAINADGERNKANKAYLEFIKANFIVPIERTTPEEEAQVLFLEEAGGFFLPVFSSQTYMDAWVTPVKEEIEVLKLSGVDLLKGIGQGVSVALNIGSDCYKIFNPAEIDRMRGMVLKIFS